jgi:hypothetical protein
MLLLFLGIATTKIWMRSAMRLSLIFAAAIGCILCFCAGYGVSLVSNYQRKNIDSKDDIYKSIILEIKKTNPEILTYSDIEIRMIKISANSRNCVFAYPSKPMAYSGKDFLYCFEDGWSGKMTRI